MRQAQAGLGRRGRQRQVWTRRTMPDRVAAGRRAPWCIPTGQSLGQSTSEQAETGRRHTGSLHSTCFSHASKLSIIESFVPAGVTWACVHHAFLHVRLYLHSLSSGFFGKVARSR